MAAWVVISGSPYAKGKCSQVSTRIASLLERHSLAVSDVSVASKPSLDVSVQSFSAANWCVKGCIGCDECKANGTCIFHDDAQRIIAALENADAVIVISPIYFAGVPSQFKALLDRFQPLYWKRQRIKAAHAELPSKLPLYVTLVGEGGDPYGTDHALAQISSPFAVAGLEIIWSASFLREDQETIFSALESAIMDAQGRID